MPEKKTSITGADIRKFIPLYERLGQLAGIADAILENAAVAVDRPPPAEDEDLIEDKLSGRVYRIATDSADVLPDLAGASALLEHQLKAPVSAAAVLLRAAVKLLREEQSLQRVARPLSESEQARIAAANQVLPALAGALEALDRIKL